MDYVKLVVEYARMIGIDDIETDGVGDAFEVDGFPVILQHDDENDRVAMLAGLGPFDPAADRGLTAQLPQLNFFSVSMGGHAISIDEESKSYYFMGSLPLEGLTLERFDAELALFVTRGRAAMDLLATARAAQKAKALETVKSTESEVVLRA